MQVTKLSIYITAHSHLFKMFRIKKMRHAYTHTHAHFSSHTHIQSVWLTDGRARLRGSESLLIASWLQLSPSLSLSFLILLGPASLPLSNFLPPSLPPSLCLSESQPLDLCVSLVGSLALALSCLSLPVAVALSQPLSLATSLSLAAFSPEIFALMLWLCRSFCVCVS